MPHPQGKDKRPPAEPSLFCSSYQYEEIKILNKKMKKVNKVIYLHVQVRHHGQREGALLPPGWQKYWPAFLSLQHNLAVECVRFQTLGLGHPSS